MDTNKKDQIRLSDRILSALELSLAQDDLKISELLTRALEYAMTRNTGGGEFIERRDYPPEMITAMAKLDELKSKEGGA